MSKRTLQVKDIKRGVQEGKRLFAEYDNFEISTCKTKDEHVIFFDYFI